MKAKLQIGRGNASLIEGTDTIELGYLVRRVFGDDLPYVKSEQGMFFRI